MEYYSLIPKKSNSLISIKEDIHFYTRISLYHGIVVLFVIMYTNPWPSDFRDGGYMILVNCIIYLIIINSLNAIFLYDEYAQNSSKSEEYGPIFQLCKTIRHMIFWVYGLYTQIMVINIGCTKLKIAFDFELNDYYLPLTGFLIWSIFCIFVDVKWLMKTCIYQQLINEKTNNIDESIVV